MCIRDRIQAFSPTCTIKKRIRKIPVSAITHFFPTEDVKSSDHFISKLLERVIKISAKILPGGQKAAKDFQPT